MTYRRIAQDARTYMILAVIALIAAVTTGGVYGLAGMAIGLTVTLLGVYVLWRLITTIGSAMGDGANPKLATLLTVFGFFIKVPVLYIAYVGTTHLGHAASSCFLAGLMLVYFAVVAWAIARQ